MNTKNLFAFALLAIGASALADDVALPKTEQVAPQQAEPVKLPPRGSNMSSVEASFGAPANREPAVGTPPITRWEYSNFIVYFENEHVIHSVVK